MSNRFTKLVFTTFSLGMIALATQRAEQHSTINQRSIASVPSKKEPSENLKRRFLHTEKLRGPVDTKLEVVGAPAENVGETFILRGVVTSKEEISGIDIKWIIPQGLEVIRGPLQETISHLMPDQPANVELTLRKLTKENVQVHLITAGSKGSFKFGESTQFNTEDQADIDRDIVRLGKSNEREMLANPPPSRKKRKVLE